MGASSKAAPCTSDLRATESYPRPGPPAAHLALAATRRELARKPELALGMHDATRVAQCAGALRAAPPKRRVIYAAVEAAGSRGGGLATGAAQRVGQGACQRPRALSPRKGSHTVIAAGPCPFEGAAFSGFQVAGWPSRPHQLFSRPLRRFQEGVRGEQRQSISVQQIPSGYPPNCRAPRLRSAKENLAWLATQAFG